MIKFIAFSVKIIMLTINKKGEGAGAAISIGERKIGER